MAAAPVLVKAYSNERRGPLRLSHASMSAAQALPPISSFAFADILRSADSPDFQQALDGIAEICAKNRMSLADEYASHLPPLGEITASSTIAERRQQLLRPGARRALTSVPEASSSGSEGSRMGKKRKRIFSFQRPKEVQDKSLRQIRIGSMGRTVSVAALAALALSDNNTPEIRAEIGKMDSVLDDNARPRAFRRTTSGCLLYTSPSPRD